MMSYKNHKVTAIVPIYNEELTINNVLVSLLNIKIIDRIIAVNDGSTDKTEKFLNTHKDQITVLSNDTNRGKGYAIAKGLDKTTTDLVLLLDADILNYSEEEIIGLIKPVVKGQCDFTMRTRKGLIVPKIFKKTSGVRCYWYKDLAPLTNAMKKTSKYGVESLLNNSLQGKSFKLVMFKGSRHVPKHKKYNIFHTIKEYLLEGLSIIRK